MEFKSEILQMYLVILYAVWNCPWVYFHRPSPALAQPTDNSSMPHNSLTAFKQLTVFQSYQLTVMPPSDLSLLENVQSKAKL